MRAIEYLEVRQQKKLWKKLRYESVVSVVKPEDYSRMTEILADLKQSIRKHDYHPGLLLGYLGMCKQEGATRFIPVMKIEDFSVYYACVSSLQEHLCFELDGVFGGWRMRSNRHKIEHDEVGDYVFDGALSKDDWFKNWKSYSEVLEHACNQATDDTFFHLTDIANFYDNIDLFKLENLLKRHVPQWDGTIDLLMHFLKYWNRTIRGYDPSSRGLPQEIVQDASRILANFYLRDLDHKIKVECDEKNIKYIRWADDITFVGKNKKALESIVHTYSLELHKIGLNLNASKTKSYTKRQVEQYNCLDIMQLLKNNDYSKIDTGIEWFKNRISEGRGKCREDRVIRRLLTILDDHSQKADALSNWDKIQAHKDWLRSLIVSDGYNSIKNLQSMSMLKLLRLYDDPIYGLGEIAPIIIDKPYTSAKAELLFAIRKMRRQLKYNNRRDELDLINERILSSASDSVIISQHCC